MQGGEGDGFLEQLDAERAAALVVAEGERALEALGTVAGVP